MLCEKISFSNELLVGAIAERRLRISTLAIACSASGRGMLVYKEVTSYVTNRGQAAQFLNLMKKDIFSVGLPKAEIIGRPGGGNLPLCIFGNIEMTRSWWVRSKIITAFFINFFVTAHGSEDVLY